MLNYKELDLLFDEILAGFSKENLEAWLTFDAEREMLEQLQQGEMVVTFHNVVLTKPLPVREPFLQELTMNDSYPLAA